MDLVLSLFPGIDLLGRGFELEGYCVVRGPDPLYGGDIREFHPPAGRFGGVVAGPPCQDFSTARRAPATGYGLAMLTEFVRCVEAAEPEWWLLENVPAVPDVRIEGYSWQRLDVRASECGLPHNRLRHVQFGQRDGRPLVLPRPERRLITSTTPLASGTGRGRSWARFCELMGLPPTFTLPALTKEARYRAVGNGVPIPVARMLSRAIRERPDCHITLCVCGCGRPVEGRRRSATDACRKRLERRRRDAAAGLAPGSVTL